MDGEGVALVVGVLAAIGVVVLWLVWRSQEGNDDLRAAADELPAAIERAKKLGIPLSGADLAPKPPVKDSENAASEIVALCTAYEGVSSIDEKMSAIQNELAGGKGDASRELSEFCGVLDHAHKASKKPKLDLHRDWNQGPLLLFNEFRPVKGAVKLLCYRAISRAKQGDDASALADLRSAFDLGRLMGSEPTSISMLVGVACDTVVLRHAEVVAQAWAGDPVRLHALAKLLEQPRPQADYAWALRGEVVFGIAACHFTDAPIKKGAKSAELQRDMEEGRAKNGPSDGGMPKSLVGRAYLARHLQLWAEVWPDILAKSADPRALGRITLELGKSAAKHRGLSYTAGSVSYPSFETIGDSAVVQTAHRRLALALVKVLAFRAEYRRMPSTLAEAGVEEVDPFDGKPLRMKVTGDSFKVYSVGPDGEDDGGTSEPKGGKWDIVHSYPPRWWQPSSARKHVETD